MADPSNPAVEVGNLVVRRGGRAVVDGATWTAQAGEVTALLGPNGAGKTTTVEALVGVRRPNGGRLRVLGRDPHLDHRELRHRVGWMPQDGGVHLGVRPREALAHRAAMYDNPWPVEGLCAALGVVGSWTKSPLRRLSGGELQRVRVALALVGRPDVVFLDEPTNGLDLESRELVWQALNTLRDNGIAVILSSHLLDDVERHADHVVVMDAGRVQVTGTMADLLRHQPSTVTLVTSDHVDLLALGAALPPDTVVKASGNETYTVSGDVDAHALAAVAGWCAAHGVTATRLTLGHGSLDDLVRTLGDGENHS